MNISEMLSKLEAIDLPIPKYTKDLSKISELKRPVVVKADSMIHKGAAGLVFLNLCTDEEIKRAANRIVSMGFEPIIQEMVRGVELLMGFRRDETLGPIVAFGLGGRMVEIEKDVKFAKLPLDRGAFERLVLKTKIGKNLEKFGVGIAELYEIFDKLQKFYLKMGFKELEVNPLIVGAEGIWIVDVRAD